MKCHICIKEISPYKSIGEDTYWTHQCGSHLYLAFNELQKRIYAYTFMCPNDPFFINGTTNSTMVFELGVGAPPDLWTTGKAIFLIPRFLPLPIDDNDVPQVSVVVNKIKRYLPYL